MALKVIRKGIYFTPDLAEDLRTAAFKSRQSESEIVRIAVATYLDSDLPDSVGSGERETDEFRISPEAREAIARLSRDKDVPIPKVVDALIRKQIPKYFRESE